MSLFSLIPNHFSWVCAPFCALVTAALLPLLSGTHHRLVSCSTLFFFSWYICIICIPFCTWFHAWLNNIGYLSSSFCSCWSIASSWTAFFVICFVQTEWVRRNNKLKINVVKVKYGNIGIKRLYLPSTTQKLEVELC